MRDIKAIFTHVSFRHLRTIKTFIERDTENKDEYRAIARTEIMALWLDGFITQNTRDILEQWLYSI